MIAHTTDFCRISCGGRFAKVALQKLEQNHRDQEDTRFIEEVLCECLTLSADHQPKTSPEH